MMNDSEMDNILSSQAEIVPSPGFAASVMEAVRREATAPPPIPFPWKRALPLLVAAGLVLLGLAAGGIAVLVAMIRGSLHLQFAVSLPQVSLGGSGIGAAMVWTGLSLLAAFIMVEGSLRLAGART